jgi:hypothetical protein
MSGKNKYFVVYGTQLSPTTVEGHTPIWTRTRNIFVFHIIMPWSLQLPGLFYYAREKLKSIITLNTISLAIRMTDGQTAIWNLIAACEARIYRV